MQITDESVASQGSANTLIWWAFGEKGAHTWEISFWRNSSLDEVLSWDQIDQKVDNVSPFLSGVVSISDSTSSKSPWLNDLGYHVSDVGGEVGSDGLEWGWICSNEVKDVHDELSSSFGGVWISSEVAWDQGKEVNACGDDSSNSWDDVKNIDGNLSSQESKEDRNVSCNLKDDLCWGEVAFSDLVSWVVEIVVEGGEGGWNGISLVVW